MNFIRSDGNQRETLFPFTYTRPVSEIRIGILTIREKWEKWLNMPLSYKTEAYLSEKFPIRTEADNTIINGRYLPHRDLVRAIQGLGPGEALLGDGDYIAYRTARPGDAFDPKSFKGLPYKGGATALKNTWDIFSLN